MVTETAAQMWDLAISPFRPSEPGARASDTIAGVLQPTEVPAAAPVAVRPLIAAPARPAAVRGMFPTAVYLDTGDDMIAVVSSDGLRLPCALVVAEPSSARPFAEISGGAAATVGDGAVVVGNDRFVVRRWSHPRRPRALHPGEALSRRVVALDALLAGAPIPLPDRCALSPSALVGLGPGLTPAGDDVLAAMLLTLSAAPAAESRRDELATETLKLLDRTTTLSATLLRHAVGGRGIPQVIDVIDALGGVGDLAAATARLVAVGHSSGAALARGVLVTARLVAAGATTDAKVA
jgi:hypothetical protein